MRLINIVAAMGAAISAVLCLAQGPALPPGYELLWIHPFAFGFVYVVLFARILRAGGRRVTVASFLVLSYLRLVVIPLISVASGSFGALMDLAVSSSALHSAILLVLYEFLVASLLVSYLAARDERTQVLRVDLRRPDELVLGGSPLVYGVYILLAALFYVAVGRHLDLLQFFVIDAPKGERLGDVASTELVLYRQIMRIALVFAFILSVSIFGRKYRMSAKARYPVISVILGLVNVGIIVGERRTEQVYMAFIVVVILVAIFPRLRGAIILAVVLFATVIVAYMSIYKHLYAFLFDSYFDAIANASISADAVSQTLQAYFFGPHNVAAVIDFSNTHSQDPTGFVYDVGRSTFGVSFFLKDVGTLTSEAFNTYVYGYGRPTGQVISGIGYGVIYFGHILSPVVTCMNIALASALEGTFAKATSLEVKYIVGYMLIRFSTNLFASSPPLISAASIMLGTAGLLYFVAKGFVVRSVAVSRTRTRLDSVDRRRGSSDRVLTRVGMR